MTVTARALSNPTQGRLDGAVAFAGDDAGVETAEVQTTVPAGVFDLQTSVLDDLETGIQGLLRRLIVA